MQRQAARNRLLIAEEWIGHLLCHAERKGYLAKTQAANLQEQYASQAYYLNAIAELDVQISAQDAAAKRRDAEHRAKTAQSRGFWARLTGHAA